MYQFHRDIQALLFSMHLLDVSRLQVSELDPGQVVQVRADAHSLAELIFSSSQVRPSATFVLAAVTELNNIVSDSWQYPLLH